MTPPSDGPGPPPHGPAPGGRTGGLREWTSSTAVRLAYVAVLTAATLHPFDFRAAPPLGQGIVEALHPSLVPRLLVDAARNLVLFAGWGALWTLTVGREETARPVRESALTGFALSLLFEIAQLWTVARNPSLLDLVSNTFGAAVGATAMVAFLRRMGRDRRRPCLLGVPAWVVAGSQLCAVALEATFPLLRSARPVVWGGPLDRLVDRVAAIEVGSLAALPLFDLVLFAPAGALVVAALVEAGRDGDRAARWTAAAGVVLAAAGEVGRGVLGQSILLGPVVVHAVALALGAWAAARWTRAAVRRSRARERAAAVGGGLVLLVLLWTWRPFLPPGQLALGESLFSVERWIPLWTLGTSADLRSVADVGISFFLFLPFGTLLAVWPVTDRSGPIGLWPAFVLAGLVELGQVFVAGRYFDATDVLVCAAGVAVGWAATRRAGYGPAGGAQKTEKSTPLR